MINIHGQAGGPGAEKFSASVVRYVYSEHTSANPGADRAEI